MIRNYFKTVISVFTLCVLLGIGGIVAYASVNSNWNYFGPVNGFYYQNMAYADKYTSSVDAGATIKPQWGGTAPASYMGAQAHLYDSAGNLKVQTNWVFNDAVSSGLSVVTANWNGNGIYYSKGDTAAYNGNGYTHYLTYQSPNVTLP